MPFGIIAARPMYAIKIASSHFALVSIIVGRLIFKCVEGFRSKFISSGIDSF